MLTNKPPSKPKYNQGFGALNRHWYRFTDLCRVCSIKWDFIGKVETSDIDSEVVMRKAGVEGTIHMGLHGRSSNNSRMIVYFKGLAKTIVAKLYNLYREDFALFGYTVNDWLWEHLADE